jgi:hypothetical protein
MNHRVDIGSRGVRIAAEWLSKNGYRARIIAVSPGVTDIEAVSPQIKMLIQVRAAIHPNEPPTLTPEEIPPFQLRAQNKSFEPWEARIQFDTGHQLVGQIIWKKL